MYRIIIYPEEWKHSSNPHNIAWAVIFSPHFARFLDLSILGIYAILVDFFLVFWFPLPLLCSAFISKLGTTVLPPGASQSVSARSTFGSRSFSKFRHSRHGRHMGAYRCGLWLLSLYWSWIKLSKGSFEGCAVNYRRVWVSVTLTQAI